MGKKIPDYFLLRNFELVWQNFFSVWKMRSQLNFFSEEYFLLLIKISFSKLLSHFDLYPRISPRIQMSFASIFSQIPWKVAGKWNFYELIFLGTKWNYSLQIFFLVEKFSQYFLLYFDFNFFSPILISQRINKTIAANFYLINYFFNWHWFLHF